MHYIWKPASSRRYSYIILWDAGPAGALTLRAVLWGTKSATNSRWHVFWRTEYVWSQKEVIPPNTTEGRLETLRAFLNIPRSELDTQNLGQRQLTRPVVSANIPGLHERYLVEGMKACTQWVLDTLPPPIQKIVLRDLRYWRNRVLTKRTKLPKVSMYYGIPVQHQTALKNYLSAARSTHRGFCAPRIADMQNPKALEAFEACAAASGGRYYETCLILDDIAYAVGFNANDTRTIRAADLKPKE